MRTSTAKQQQNTYFRFGDNISCKTIEFKDEYHHAWIVKLEVCDSGTIGKDFLDLERSIMPEKSNSIILADLLFIMGYRTKAENYLNQISDVEDVALVHFTLAKIHYNRGDYDLALEHFQISYELMMSEEPPRRIDSATILHSIAYIFNQKNDLFEALVYQQKALDIHLECLVPDDIRLGISYYNVSLALKNINQFDKALSYYQQARIAWSQSLPYDHVLIADSIHSIAAIYYCKRQYREALEYFEEALKLYKRLSSANEGVILKIENVIEDLKGTGSITA
ncbi:unnamed protein product [Didymodactylos carnosus]|uniref:Tetratricopeptide repeat protein n=1 Tax=Didymodactylos carnosus TaxID=1234261 RepID=A0A815GB97_9BILA|nr:unnamed protein product [Didymodactylos carnosus]CAF1337107.1 unnamed protein product [Didymodactylos carnosus]CAF3858104.1 unnamed protein product [Didymodactylos carnosus]CAF4195226.1 unnamed protein product [Didymodactylos carnosus]